MTAPGQDTWGIDAISLDRADNVATVLRALGPGDLARVRCGADLAEIEVKEQVAFGHKLALRDIGAGSEVMKYGTPIGRATQHIGAGSHVHVHNLVSVRARPRNA